MATVSIGERKFVGPSAPSQAKACDSAAEAALQVVRTRSCLCMEGGDFCADIGMEIFQKPSGLCAVMGLIENLSGLCLLCLYGL